MAIYIANHNEPIDTSFVNEDYINKFINESDYALSVIIQETDINDSKYYPEVLNELSYKLYYRIKKAIEKTVAFIRDMFRKFIQWLSSFASKGKNINQKFIEYYRDHKDTINATLDGIMNGSIPASEQTFYIYEYFGLDGIDDELLQSMKKGINDLENKSEYKDFIHKCSRYIAGDTNDEPTEEYEKLYASRVKDFFSRVRYVDFDGKDENLNYRTSNTEFIKDITEYLRGEEVTINSSNARDIKLHMEEIDNIGIAGFAKNINYIQGILKESHDKATMGMEKFQTIFADEIASSEAGDTDARITKCFGYYSKVITNVFNMSSNILNAMVSLRMNMLQSYFGIMRYLVSIDSSANTTNESSGMFESVKFM